MKEIRGRRFPNERDLYAAKDIKLVDCVFDGAEDGESALKEAKNIVLENCFMNLRYPLWHDGGVTLSGCSMSENCRAALWYSSDIRVTDSKLHGIKALRECDGATIENSEIVSPEFGWKSRNVTLNQTTVQSEYLFLLAQDLRLNGVNFKGKYSFQYVENATVENSVLDTKDAFWHCKNVTVKNSVVKGEYLGWYSENLTFINCKIIGTQPLCYCKKLKLVGCEMADTDLSFEYSEVEAEIKGTVLSVKHPKSGRITADAVSEIILTDDSQVQCECEIYQRRIA